MKNTKFLEIISVKTKTGLLFIFTFIVFLSGKKASKTITYTDIVDRLIDLKDLAELPEQGEKSVMWSRYDR